MMISMKIPDIKRQDQTTFRNENPCSTETQHQMSKEILISGWFFLKAHSLLSMRVRELVDFFQKKNSQEYMYIWRLQHTLNIFINICTCISFSLLPQVKKPVEDAAFPEHFNYNATFPFRATELASISITENRADKGLESPSHLYPCMGPRSVLLRVFIPGS